MPPDADSKSPATVLDWLLLKYPTAKRTTLKEMLPRIRVNASPARALKQALNKGDVVELFRPRPKAAPQAARLPFKVVFEDADILVIDKPTSLLTSTTVRETRTTVLGLVREYVRANEPTARLGLIHRLDKEASGLLIFSKNEAAYESLKDQFFKHTVARVYVAVARGDVKPRAGRIEMRLVEERDGKMRHTTAHGKGELAVTHYRVIRNEAGRSLVEVTLETGKKHQIRAALSSKGWPILNDAMYGTRAVEGRLMLAAVRLEIAHPRTGKRQTFEIKPPRDFTMTQ